jgi:hypothetical protein
MANPISVPGTVIPSGAAISPGGAQGVQGLQGPQGIPWQGFMSKTTAYTLTTGDNGKYVICSGGSWTLTLPAPALGLAFQVRNDMGISGTVGTITLQPTGGTINGQASIQLLPQQECTLITDGTNWRTFELRREIILGTQDITSTTASAVILLPAGYRYFELELDQIAMDTDNASIAFQLSVNGGSTWLSGATAYLEGTVYDSTATVASYQSATFSAGSLSCAQTTLAINNGGGSSRLRLNPGSATIAATWNLTSGGWTTAGGNRLRSFYTQGSYNAAPAGVMNALKYSASSGNITRAFLTVKGVV